MREQRNNLMWKNKRGAIPALVYFCIVININSVSVIEKYLSGESFLDGKTPNKKSSVDVDKWLAEQTQKRIAPQKKEITSERIPPPPDKKELFKLEDIFLPKELPKVDVRSVLSVPLEKTIDSKLNDAFALKGIDTIIVWSGDNNYVPEKHEKNFAVIGVVISPLLFEMISNIAIKKNRSVPNLLRLILIEHFQSGKDIIYHDLKENTKQIMCTLPLSLREKVEETARVAGSVSRVIRSLLWEYANDYYKNKNEEA